MSEQFEDLGTKLPDFSSVLAQRIATKTNSISDNPAPGTVDPYKLMLHRKNQSEAGDINPCEIVRWPEEDTQVLKDYCMKMGIYGFNTRLHPRLVLAQLKKQLGDDYTGVPLDQRVPKGYEKMGTKSSYSENYPYSEAMRQKQIIHG